MARPGGRSRHVGAPELALQLVVTRGNTKLAALAVDVLRTLRCLSRPRQLRLILDAGASVSNDGLSRLDRFYKTVLSITSRATASVSTTSGSIPHPRLGDALHKRAARSTDGARTQSAFAELQTEILAGRA